MHYAWSLVFLSICLSSSRVHLRKGPEYLTSGTAQVFIPLMRFLLESFVSSSFRVLLRYSFSDRVFHLHLFDGVSLQDTQVFVGFIFFERPNSVVIWYSIPSVICRLPLFMTSMEHFSMPNSIPMS